MVFFDLAQIWLPGAEAWLAPEPEPHEEPEDGLEVAAEEDAPDGAFVCR